MLCCATCYDFLAVFDTTCIFDGTLKIQPEPILASAYTVADMKRMQLDVLSPIFSYIEGPDDLARCSLVSKGWAAAVLQARPISLKMHHYRDLHHDEDDPLL